MAKYNKQTKEYTSRYIPPTLKMLFLRVRSNKFHIKKECYKNINKKYKELDWTRDYFYSKELREAIEDKYFKCWRRMYADKELRPNGRLTDCRYSKNNAEMICFLKEVSAFTEDRIHYTKKKKRKMPEEIDFYFDSIYIGRKKLFKFAKTKEWKVKAVTDYLKTKEYLFDKESPFYKGFE
jgi:hypothetical protein